MQLPGFLGCDKDRSRQVLNQLKSRLLPAKKLIVPLKVTGDSLRAVDIALLP
jgi:hypothetical protein